MKPSKALPTLLSSSSTATLRKAKATSFSLLNSSLPYPNSRTRNVYGIKAPFFTRNATTNSSLFQLPLAAAAHPYASSPSSASLIASDVEPSSEFQGSASPQEPPAMEVLIEKAVYKCRFLAFFGVLGSLIGSFLCFVKGCTIVAESFMEYFVSHGKVIKLLVEAIDALADVYLLGTVMLVFGMGLYELFVSNLDIAKMSSASGYGHRNCSSFFGMFTLMERPRWLEIKTVNELKTKLGHVIVMLLLIGLFDKSYKAAIYSPTDLLCFAASVLLCSGCLYLLSKLNGST